MILQNNSKVKLEVIDGDIVRKTFTYDIHCDNLWLHRYNELRHWDPRLVEVYNVGPNYIEMRHINPSDSVESVFKNKTNHTLDQRIDICVQYLDIMSANQKRLSLDNNMFVHTDIWSGNVLVKDDMSLVVIDPDSCTADPDLANLYGDFVSNFLRATNKYYGMLRQKAGR